MDIVKQHVAARILYFNSRLRGIFTALVFAYVLAAIAGYAAAQFYPGYATFVYDAIRANFESRGFFSAGSGFELFPLIFLNNLTAALVTIASGIIPVLCLPALAVVFNGLALGIIEAILGQENRSIAETLVALVPHGIFELPAFFYAAALGLRRLAST